MRLELDDLDEFMLLASDGVWDVVRSILDVRGARLRITAGRSRPGLRL